MEFKITLEIDAEAENKSEIILELSDSLESFFSTRNYGGDIKKYLLGCICIRTKAGYEDWYKIRKPKYIEYKKNKNRLTGIEIEIEKTFENDFKLDNAIYQEFIGSSDEKSRKILAKEILISLANLDALPKKVINFDKEAFKNDMQCFFEDRGLI